MTKIKKVIGITILVLIALISIYSYKFYQKHFLLDVEYEKGLKFCFDKLEEKDKNILSNKYFYFNFWDTRCKPCIKEMPALDSIANLTKAKIAYIYLSDEDDETINGFLKRKNIISKNFIYLNDMNYFMSAVYKKVNGKFKAYPTHVVTDSTGNILYFSQGGLISINFEKLNISKEKKDTLEERMKDPLIKFLQNLK